MRTLKELLQLTLEEGNKNFKKGNEIYYDGFTGLCGFVNNHMYKHGVITSGEHNMLDGFINTNRPLQNSPHYRKSMAYQAYFWKQYTWAPRKKWLIDQIKNMK